MQEKKFEFVTIDVAPDYEICEAGLVRSKTRHITDRNGVTRCRKAQYMSVQETGYLNVIVKDEFEVSTSVALYVPNLVLKAFKNIDVKSSDIIILDDTLPVTKRFALDNLICKDTLFVEAEHTPIKGNTIYRIVSHILHHAEMYDEDTIVKADKINSKYLIEGEDSKPINRINYYYIEFKYNGNVFVKKDSEKSEVSREKERAKKFAQKKTYSSSKKIDNNVVKEETIIEDTNVSESSNKINIPSIVKKIENNKIEETVKTEVVEEEPINNVETVLGQKITSLSPYKKVKIGQLYIKLELLSLSEVRFYLVEEEEATIFYESDPNLEYIVRKTRGEVVHLCY